MLYMMVGKDANYTANYGSRPIYTYLQVPAYFTQGNDGCWYNITSVYCSNLEYEEGIVALVCFDMLHKCQLQIHNLAYCGLI